MMYTNIQQHFRYYLALTLSVLLAVGVRLQAAPLGLNSVTTDEVNANKPTGRQVSSPSDAVAVR